MEWRPDAALDSRRIARPSLVVIVEGARGSAAHRRAASSDLARRQLGYGRGRRMAIEQDRRDPGVRRGRTLGSPIALLIRNRDWANWQHTMSVEADLPESAGARGETSSRGRGPVTPTSPAGLKYGHTDLRDVLERASARETAARVAPARSHERCSAGMASKRQATSSRSVRRPSTIRWRSRSPQARALAPDDDVRCVDGAVGGR